MYRWFVALIFLAASVANGLTSLPEVDWHGPVPVVEADANEPVLGSVEVAVRPARSLAERIRTWAPLWLLPRPQASCPDALPCAVGVVACSAETRLPSDRLLSPEIGPRGPPSA